jgi:hypothetical protein
MFKIAFLTLSLLLGSTLSVAQITSPHGDTATRQSAPTTQAAPMSYGSSQALAQLETVAQSTITDLGRVRVDKWKVASRDKDQARSNLESLQRNLNSALPALIQQVRANPSSVAANVKLYRNLNALYDVLASFSESTGAFGAQDDYNALSRDSADFDTVRRAWADQLEQMAAAQDAQVARLTEQARVLQQTPPAATPAKKVVVDDNPPAKKSVTPKKKPATTTSTSKTPNPQ